MSILYKYISREIFRHFGMVLAVVIGIYVAVDFFEKIDDFLEADVSLIKALIFFILKTPFIIAQIIPVCILLAVLITFGLMIKNNEMVSLKSSGISIYYLFVPVFSIGFLMSILLFFLSEVFVPITMGKANKIWIGDVRQESVLISKEKNIWIKGNRSITHIEYYNSAKKSIFGITLNRFDENFRLIKRVDAKKGIFEQGRWVLHEIMVQELNKKDDKQKVVFHKKMVENLDFLPDDLKRVAKKSEEMSFKELLAFIKKTEAEGYDATTYKVDLHAKMAFPFVCIIMCMVGTGIALRGKTKEGLAISIASGIGIAFLYWIVYSFCMSLGYGEMLPPAIAAWTANLIFSCFGVLTLMNAP